MTKIVELQDDIYPFGCKGDVVGLSEKELKALDAEAKKRNVRNVYNLINEPVETGSEPAVQDSEGGPESGDDESERENKLAAKKKSK